MITEDLLDHENTDRLFRFIPAPEMATIQLHEEKVKRSIWTGAIKRQTVLVVRKIEGDWWFIFCGGLEGWAYIPSQLSAKTMIELHQLRRYEDWKGNNQFFCYGKIMLGSDAKFFAFTNFLIIVPSIVFFVCVVPNMYHPIKTMVCL